MGYKSTDRKCVLTVGALCRNETKKNRLTSGALCRNNQNQSPLTNGSLYAGMAVFFTNQFIRKKH